jgi:cytochrome c oxidase subunit 2
LRLGSIDVKILLAIVVALPGSAATAVAQPNLEVGQSTFEICAGCHGFLAEGNRLVNAPRLAGLESWYLATQMRNFAAGIRGAAAGDVHGQRMAVMAGAVDSDRELEDLIAYIETLPVTSAPARVDGDAQRGERQYATCAACHGREGRGNEALSAPGLAGLDDWYIVEQLRLYAEGLRGTHPEDTYGRQMRAVASTFADEQTRQDLATYIESLGD